MAKRTPTPPGHLDQLVETLPELDIEAATVAQVKAIGDMIADRLAAMKHNHPDRDALETAWLNARMSGDRIVEARRLSQQAEAYMSDVDRALERVRKGS